MSYRLSMLLVVVLSLLSIVAPVAAQGEVIASGLNGPRNLTYDSDGNLYIVEMGLGGDFETQGPFGPVNVGPTGQITRVTPDGQQSVFIPFLISMDNGFRGAMDIHVTDDAVWLVLGEGPLTTPYTHAVLELDRETLRVRKFIDLYAHEAANNPDGDIINSNPADLAIADDGTLFIADAGCNCVVRWTPDTGAETFAAWPLGETADVPTSVAFGPDGSLYIGFLSGFPFPAQGARIERWSTDGELLQTYEGLTLVTDVLVTDDGTIYAVELASGFGDQGYFPDSGRVVIVSEDGLTPVAEGLNFPYGLAQAPDGSLVVGINALPLGEGIGSVIRLSM